MASPTAPAARAEPQQREAGALAAQAAAVQAVRPAAHQAAPTAVASQSSQEPSLPTWAEAPPQVSPHLLLLPIQSQALPLAQASQHLSVCPPIVKHVAPSSADPLSNVMSFA